MSQSYYVQVELYLQPRVVSSLYQDLDQMPLLRHIQLTTSGANAILDSSLFQIHASGLHTPLPVTLSTASGTHVASIPNYVVAMVLMFQHQLHTQIIVSKVGQRWPFPSEVYQHGVVPYARMTYGRCAGILGYGNLGRETARLLHAHGMRIVAANSNGQRVAHQSSIFRGLGDDHATIPEQMFSTSDERSFDQFLSQCDVLVALLPATAQTHHLLNADQLCRLKPNAVVINVGRGDLISSSEVLKTLDTGHLLGVALDVTDEEPLPDGHPLFTHPPLRDNSPYFW